MKRICVDARLLGFSGIGSYLANILPRIIDSSYEWAVITRMGAQNDYPFLKKMSVIETDISVFSIQELLKLHTIIPPCDLYWTPHFNQSLIPPSARTIITTLCDTYHRTFFNTLKLSEKMYVKYLLPRFIHRSRRILTISDFSQHEIIRYFPRVKERITKIYPAIDHDIFHPLVPFNADLSEKYHLPKHYFLSVGTHKFHKNLQGLIKGFSLFLQKHDAYLLICGSQKGLINSISVDSLLQADSRLASRVRILGAPPTEDLPFLYRNALAFVFPSFYEGFGLPPLEAMACGCPTIVSNQASLPEVCAMASHYVDPRDITSIADALQTLFSNTSLRQELSEKGLQHVQCYSWDKAAKEHLEVFHSALSAKMP